MPTQQLTTQDFKNKVFDYETETEWKHKGELPIIIDFYADWCGPCKMVAPILEELSDEYDGKLIIYKVDSDKEMELASVFSHPEYTHFSVHPCRGRPHAATGRFPQESLQGDH